MSTQRKNTFNIHSITPIPSRSVINNREPVKNIKNGSHSCN